MAKKIIKHQCDPKLFDNKVAYYHSCHEDEEALYSVLMEDMSEFAEAGCGKCITTLFQAIVGIHSSNEKKLDKLRWLLDITQNNPDYGFIDDENCIIHLIYGMIRNNNNWDLANPVIWIQGESEKFEDLIKNNKREVLEPSLENEKLKDEEANLMEIGKQTGKASQQSEPKTLEDFKTHENKLWKGIPIEVAIKHFKVLTEMKSKNGRTFLTNEQLISFIQRAFLKDEQQPKQKINFAIGEKGFVIKRFYEFFILAATEYGGANKKEKYINLIHNNFNNLGTLQTIQSFFRPNKTKENWE